MVSRGAYCLGVVAVVVAATMCLVQPTMGINIRRFDLFEHESLVHFGQDGGVFELDGDSDEAKLKVHFYELIGLMGDFWGAGSFTDSICLANDPPRRFFEIADQIKGTWRSHGGIAKRNALIHGLRKQLRNELEKFKGADVEAEMSMEEVIKQLNDAKKASPPSDFGSNDMVNMRRELVRVGDMNTQADILGGNIDHFSECAVKITDKVSREINAMFRAGMLKEANFYLASMFHFTSDLFSAGHTITPYFFGCRGAKASINEGLTRNAMHDECNINGLPVKNSIGEWTAYGDMWLYSNKARLQRKWVWESLKRIKDNVLSNDFNPYTVLGLLPKWDRSKEQPCPMYLKVDDLMMLRINFLPQDADCGGHDTASWFAKGGVTSVAKEHAIGVATSVGNIASSSWGYLSSFWSKQDPEVVQQQAEEQPEKPDSQKTAVLVHGKKCCYSYATCFGKKSAAGDAGKYKDFTQGALWDSASATVEGIKAISPSLPGSQAPEPLTKPFKLVTKNDPALNGIRDQEPPSF